MAAELTGKLNLDVRGFLTALVSALNRGTQELNAWVAKNSAAKIGIRADGSQATAELNRLSDNAKKTGAAAGGALSNIPASVNTAPAHDQMGRLLSDAKKTGAETQQALSGGANAASGLGGVLGGLKFAGIAAGVGFLAKEMISGNATMENYRAQFEVMTGSIQNADKLLGDIKAFGAKTPFEVTDLTQASKVLLQFGISQTEIMPTLQMLGDVSGGNAEKLQSLSLVFGQISASGRLTGGDLLQLINAGFNPLQVISQKTGKSVAELKKEMEDGAISADMVRDAFKTATSQGGQFFGMMEKQAGTFDGMLSTFKDLVGEMLRTLGGPVFTAAKSILGGLTEALSAPAVQQALQGLGGLIATTVGGLLPVLTGLIAPISQLLVPLIGTLSQILTPVTQFVGQIGGLVGQMVTELVGPISDLLNTLSGAVGSILTSVFRAVLEAVQPVLPVFSGLVRAISPLLGAVGDLVASVAPLVPLVLSLLDPIISLATTLIGPILIAVTAIIAPLTSFIGLLGSGITFIAQTEGVLAALVAAVAAYLIVTNASAIATAAMTVIHGIQAVVTGGATAAMWLLNAAMSANPVALLIIGVAALVAGLGALAASSEDSAKEQLELAEAEQKLIDLEKKSVQTQIDRQKNVKKLAEEYDGLAKKSKRSADEEKRLQDLQTQLNAQYPGLISNTKSFGQNLSAVAEVSRQATTEIGKLNAQMADLDKRARESAIRISNLKASVAGQDFMDALEDATEGILGFGEGLAGDKEVQSLTRAINNARTFAEVTAARLELEKKIAAARKAGDIDDKEQLDVLTKLGEFAGKKIEALDLAAQAAAPVATEPPPKKDPPPTPPPTKEKEKSTLAADFLKDAERLEQEAERIRRDRDIKATDEALARVRADYEERRRLINQEVDNAKKANEEKKAAEEKSKKDITGLTDAFNKVQAALEAKRVQQLNTARQEEARAVLDALVKQQDDRVKAQIEALRREEELIVGEDAASIRRRGELRQQALSLQTEADVAAAARQAAAFRTAFAEMQTRFTAEAINADDFQRQLSELLNAGVPAVAELQRRTAAASRGLLEGTIKPREYQKVVREAINAAVSGVSSTEVAGAIQKAGVAILRETAALRKALRDAELKEEETRASLIAEGAARDRALAELEAKKTLAAELERLDEIEAQLQERIAAATDPAQRAALNALLVDLTTARVRAEIAAEGAIADARAKYLRETDILYTASYQLRTALVDAFREVDNSAAEEERKKRAEELENQRADVRESYAAGRISLKERNKQMAALDAELSAVQSSGAKKTVDTLEDLWTTLDGVLIRSARQVANQKTADAKVAQDDYLKLLTSGAADEETLNKARTKAVEQTALSLSATLAAVALEGGDTLKSFGSQAVEIAFATLDALAPSIIALIFGESVAKDPLFGALLAGALTSTFLWLKSQAKKTLKLKEGHSRLPGNPADGDSIPALLQPGERVVTERINRKWFDVLEDISSDRDPTPRLLRRLMMGPQLSTFSVNERGDIVAAQRAEHRAATALVAVGNMAVAVEDMAAELSFIRKSSKVTADGTTEIAKAARKKPRPPKKSVG